MVYNILYSLIVLSKALKAKAKADQQTLKRKDLMLNPLDFQGRTTKQLVEDYIGLLQDYPVSLHYMLLIKLVSYVCIEVEIGSFPGEDRWVKEVQTLSSVLALHPHSIAPFRCVRHSSNRP